MVVAWAILLQAALLSFTSAVHAATLLSQPAEGVVLCSARGLLAGSEAPPQKDRRPDCQCCVMACRMACGANGALLPAIAHVPLPAFRPSASGVSLSEAPVSHSALIFTARPRGPPLV